MSAPASPPVVVVGAGLAGLRCAHVLADAGVPVRVFEADGEVGGRVRTDVTADGFRLDRGFQVLFDAYPALRRALPDRAPLAPRAFAAGALVATADGLTALRSPLHHPRALLGAATSPLLTAGDGVRLAGLAADVLAADWDGVRDVRGVPRTILQEIRAHGLSARAVETLIRPFWAGITLRRDLGTSADVFRFMLRMLLRGRAILPATGIQALPRALAAALPAATIKLGSPVEAVLKEGGSVAGLRVGGATLPATQVVLAVDGAAASRLLEVPIPAPALGCVTVYLAGRHRLYRGPLLVLDGTGRATVNHAALLTNVAPEYAPPGWQLLSATVLADRADADDAALVAQVRADLQRWFPHGDLAEWRLLAVVRVPAAQFEQPPGIHARLPGVRTAVRGLYLAGEAVEDSGINGALRSGEAAARAVLADRRPGWRPT